MLRPWNVNWGAMMEAGLLDRRVIALGQLDAGAEAISPSKLNLLPTTLHLQR